MNNLTHYRVLSHPFNLSMPEKNIWGVESGPTRASSDAYIIFMHPLPPGNHVFEFKVSVPGTDPQTPGYAFSVKYNLIVQN